MNTSTWITLLVLAVAATRLVAQRYHRWHYQDRWIPSARVLPDGSHISVRQTREAPPGETYQEWHPPGAGGRWRDIPPTEEARGPYYAEKYLRGDSR